jgi:hypothetical protein
MKMRKPLGERPFGNLRGTSCRDERRLNWLRIVTSGLTVSTLVGISVVLLCHGHGLTSFCTTQKYDSEEHSYEHIDSTKKKKKKKYIYIYIPLKYVKDTAHITIPN